MFAESMQSLPHDLQKKKFSGRKIGKTQQFVNSAKLFCDKAGQPVGNHADWHPQKGSQAKGGKLAKLQDIARKEQVILRRCPVTNRECCPVYC
jgi:hypothetical protein